ncbi:hypothetical protein H4R18_003770, partial [Coemansia javaensis]
LRARRTLTAPRPPCAASRRRSATPAAPPGRRASSCGPWPAPATTPPRSAPGSAPATCPPPSPPPSTTRCSFSTTPASGSATRRARRTLTAPRPPVRLPR